LNTFNLILEYVGTGILMISATLRAEIPEKVMLSFWISLTGSLIMFTYSIITHQYGVAMLNIYSAAMNVRSIKNWWSKRVI